MPGIETVAVDMSKVVFVSVVRDHRMYSRCVRDNASAVGDKVLLDNAVENLPVPLQYNRFIESWNYDEDVWFVFCHEDFETREDVAEKLKGLDQDCIYGPCGARHRKYLGLVSRWEVSGRIYESCKDFSGEHFVGRSRKTGTLLDTLDCMCIIVHSSLVKRASLRFDERLRFDLYAEDFCASALKFHGIKTKLLNFCCAHHSTRTALPQAYFDGLDYLADKFPDDCFSGTCSYVGGCKIARNLCGPTLWLARLVVKIFGCGGMRK